MSLWLDVLISLVCALSSADSSEPLLSPSTGVGGAKVLLLNLNAYDQPYPVYPIGLAYLQGALRSGGHQTRIWDCRFSAETLEQIIAAVAKERGLHMIFSVSDEANVAWADPGLDLTAEIIKRVDAAPKK